MGELRAQQNAVNRMMRTKKENRTGPTPRHVITVDDVTRGLGLDYVLNQRIHKIVKDASPSFSQKTQTQRLMHATGSFVTFLKTLTELSSDVRQELVKRAKAYWKRTYQTDYGKNPTVKLVYKSKVPSPRVHLVVTADDLQKGSRGGKYFRRVAKMGGGYRYFYTRDAYERAHGEEAHRNGAEERKAYEKAKLKKLMPRLVVHKNGR